MLNSRISLRSQDEDSGVVITVQDRVYGIDNDDLQYIFDHFFITSVGQEKGSVGLGLHIAYEIVKAHEGNIFVSSRKGGGTTFSIYLPHPKE